MPLGKLKADSRDSRRDTDATVVFQQPVKSYPSRGDARLRKVYPAAREGGRDVGATSFSAAM